MSIRPLGLVLVNIFRHYYVITLTALGMEVMMIFVINVFRRQGCPHLGQGMEVWGQVMYKIIDLSTTVNQTDIE